MKTKAKIINIIGLSLVLVAIYTGCSKKTVDTDTSSAADNASAESSFSTVFRSTNQNSDSVAARSGCPSITITSNGPTHYPKTLTVDYGSTGCNGKKGSYTAVFSGPFKTQNSTITITYYNYYDGDYKINADSHTITNNGVNSANHLVYTVSVVNGTLTSSTGTTSTWNASRSIEWTVGSNTPWGDDVFLISGVTNGTSAKGVTYSTAINTPLQIADGCDYIESGVLTLTPQSGDNRVIDFGSGVCDNTATVTINGVVFNITM
jgi:hypothetical protein